MARLCVDLTNPARWRENYGVASDAARPLDANSFTASRLDVRVRWSSEVQVRNKLRFAGRRLQCRFEPERDIVRERATQRGTYVVHAEQVLSRQIRPAARQQRERATWEARPQAGIGPNPGPHEAAVDPI